MATQSIPTVSCLSIRNGLLAAKILATSDAELLGRLKNYSAELKEQVEQKDARLQREGYKAYLEGRKKG